jgi:hypothetical protein
VVYRKGELSSGAIDRGRSHQVALPESKMVGASHSVIHAFCEDLSLCPRGHAVYHEGQWWNVFCFAEKDHAEKFRQQFGGETFDPTQKGKGSNWTRWRK